MITVYSKSNCQPCRLTKARLDKMGVQYATKDVEQDQEAFDEAMALGHKQMPIVVNGDDHWSGFRPDLIAELEVGR